MTRAVCTNCRGKFTRRADEDWKTLCLSCWKTHATSGLKLTAASLREQLAENRRLQSQLDYVRGELAEALARHVPTKAAIPAEMIKRLTHLCHPDRHGGSVAATKATQWLLQQRGKR